MFFLNAPFHQTKNIEIFSIVMCSKFSLSWRYVEILGTEQNLKYMLETIKTIKIIILCYFIIFKNQHLKFWYFPTSVAASTVFHHPQKVTHHFKKVGNAQNFDKCNFLSASCALGSKTEACYLAVGCGQVMSHVW